MTGDLARYVREGDLPTAAQLVPARQLIAEAHDRRLDEPVRSWAQVEGIVADIAYRPGWELAIAAPAPGFDDLGPTGAALRVTCRVTDTRTLDDRRLAPAPREGIIGHLHQLPPLELMRTVGAVLGAVLECLQRVELHESAEWFRYRSRIVVDPHNGPDGRDDYTGRAGIRALRERRP